MILCQSSICKIFDVFCDGKILLRMRDGAGMGYHQSGDI